MASVAAAFIWTDMESHDDHAQKITPRCPLLPKQRRVFDMLAAAPLLWRSYEEVHFQVAGLSFKDAKRVVRELWMMREIELAETPIGTRFRIGARKSSL